MERGVVKAGAFGRARRALRAILYCLVRGVGLFRDHKRSCPCCGFEGRFLPYGDPPRASAQCPACGSLERDRLLFDCDRVTNCIGQGGKVLHFAPEAILERRLRALADDYSSADLAPGKADLVVNIEEIDLPDDSYDLVIAKHVLEHVDDRKAMKELYRILTPTGRLILMVPLVEAWAESYENPAVTSPADRKLHFGQSDHVRYYGRDFRDRLRAAGFVLEEYQAAPEDCVAKGLIYGDTVFIARKEAAA